MSLGIYRSIASTFWTDPKIAEFSAEDRYMMLYLLTNPRTTLAGTMELNYRQIAFEIGHSVESAVCIIRRLDEKHKVIMLSEETNEILIKNWYKYNWSGGSPKVLAAIKTVVKWTKNEEFKAYILDRVSEFEKRKEAKENNNNIITETETETETETDTDVSVGYEYPIDTLSDDDKNKKPKKRETKPFKKPTLEEIKAYCEERKNKIDAAYFYDHYESNGWKVGKTGMKDWKATVRNWERNGYSGSGRKATTCGDNKSQEFMDFEPF